MTAREKLDQAAKKLHGLPTEDLKKAAIHMAKGTGGAEEGIALVKILEVLEVRLGEHFIEFCENL